MSHRHLLPFLPHHPILNLGKIFQYIKLEEIWACSLNHSEPPGVHLWAENTFVCSNKTRCKSKGSQFIIPSTGNSFLPPNLHLGKSVFKI